MRVVNCLGAINCAGVKLCPSTLKCDTPLQCVSKNVFLRIHLLETNSWFWLLQVSTYQMAILMLFNNANCYSVRQIRELTNLDENMLNQILNIFLKARILMVIAGDASEEQLRQQQTEESTLASTSDALPTLTPDTLLTLFFNYNKQVIVRYVLIYQNCYFL